MKIHYLQHVPFEGLASIENWAVKHHHVLSATRFYTNDPISYLDDIDWLVVMGGPMNIVQFITAKAHSLSLAWRYL